MKGVEYFWDLEGEDLVIIESTLEKYPILARFRYNPDGGREAEGEFRELLLGLNIPTKVGQADEAVEKAGSVIKDLYSGKITPEECYNKYY